MSNLLEQARQGANLSHLDIVDMHAHIDVGFAVPGDTSAAGIVASMDRAGIAATAVTPSSPVSSEDAARENEAVFAGMEAFPGRILGYLRPWPVAEAISVDAAAAEVARGYTGVKLYTTLGVDYLNPSYAPYLAVAHEQRRPVLFHLWGDERDLDAVRAIAVRYPKASLLAGHAGSRNEEAYIQLAKNCPNVYLDLTLSFSPRGLVERLVDAVGAHRIVWGSDAALFSQAQQLGKVLGARISDEDIHRILSLNAREILGRIEAAS